MRAFNILALNRNFEIVAIVSYINLQWSRKWNECGTFSFSIPIEQYDSSWKYIYTKDRPEVGLISQINYLVNSGLKTMTISGYFLEKELDKMVVFPLQSSTDHRESMWYDDEPSMSNIAVSYCDAEHIQGTADNVALEYFRKFKKINFWNYTGLNQATNKYFELDILEGTKESGQYKLSDHYRNGEQLGYKIYDILKPSGGSYRIRLNFDTQKKYFDILIGKDKTQENTQGRNPIVFSTKYGNVINPNIVISDNEYVDGYISSEKYTVKTDLAGSTDQVTNEYTAINVKCNSDAVGVFKFLASGVKSSDYKLRDYPSSSTVSADSTYNTFGYKKAVADDLASKLTGLNAQTINIEFDSGNSSYDYITDFDIGDLVSLEIPEIKLSADVRLIGCYEVIEDGKWTLSLEFGTPIIK